MHEAKAVEERHNNKTFSRVKTDTHAHSRQTNVCIDTD